ncbi:MAG: hypothetical protein GXP31_16720 [Kiritimatiellaeota bacterium]|nr:hypothetical protein [Kiritimatiellota bacterium]
MIQRVMRFGLYGAAFGGILFAMGIAGWLCALALGVEEDSSATGMAFVAPFYIATFAIGGATTGLLWHWRRNVLGAILVGVAATSVVLGGCTLLAVYIITRTQPESLDVSAFAILALCMVAVVSGTLLGLRLRTIT